jgi:lauroyl/myristoyl acyltransferase
MTDESRAPDSGVRYSPHRRIQSAGLRHVARRTRERSVIGGYRVAEAALGRLSPRISAPVARSLFLGGYYGWPQKRRIVLANAAHVLGLPVTDPAVARLARRIYASYSQFALDVMRLTSRPVDEPLTLMKSVPGRGMESFMDLWQHYSGQGRGIIAVSGHIGSIEVFAAASSLRGVPTYGLADDTEYPELVARLTEVRERRGIGVIPWRNLRDVFRALRQPAVLGLLVDWGYRPNDVPVKLFGAWTTLPAGPATLAARTGAVILPVVNRRQGDGSYLASHAAPIEVADSSPAEVLRATQAIADALESMVGEAPEQWFTFKPMWPATEAEARALQERAASMSAAVSVARSGKHRTPDAGTAA